MSSRRTSAARSLPATAAASARLAREDAPSAAAPSVARKKKGGAQKRAVARALEDGDEEDNIVEEPDSEELAAARRLANCPGVEPRLEYSDAHGSGYLFHNSGRFADPFISRKSARAEVKATKMAAAVAAAAAAATSAQKKHKGTTGASRAVPQGGGSAAPATSTASAVIMRCSGSCRLARPCPTEKNKDGRGACGNVVTRVLCTAARPAAFGCVAWSVSTRTSLRAVP